MNFPFLKFPIRDFNKIESLQELREQLLNLLLLIAFTMGSILYVIALLPVIDKGLSTVSLIYSLLYVWLALVTFMRRAPYTVRAASWLLFFYLLGTINLVLSGFNTDAGMCFLTFVSMAALLFDLRQGLIALGISTVTIALAGYFVVSRGADLHLGLPQSDPLLWVIGGMIFVVTGIFLIFSLTVLVRGLLANLTKATTEAEKLEQANQALRASEERYRTLVEISPDLVTLIGLDGKIILTNQPGLALFHYEAVSQVAGDDFLTFIAPGDRPFLAEAFQKTLDRGSAREIVCQCVRKDGTLFYAEFSTSLIVYANGASQAVIGVGRDITARKRAEQALQEASDELENKVRERTAELVSASERLRESEETGRVILNATTASLSLMDSAGTVLAANKITVQRLGKDLDEILGKTVYQFFPEEVANSRKIQIDKVFRTGETLHYEDSREGIWFENYIYPILDADGNVARVVISARDVTERKRMEQSLADAKNELEGRVVERTRELTESREQLRKLTKDVILAQEEERRRVSRELHDEAGQALVSMKYGLESILSELPSAHFPIRTRLASAVQQLDQTMEQIRHLAHSLRPPLFDIADLDLTLKDYCREFAESTGLQIEYSGASVPDLSEEAGLSFFRFLQESLTNIIKHANATRVTVNLSRQAGRLCLSVTDNGVGASDMRTDGRGHIGMRERFMMLNGEVQIETSEQSGFVITASIPCDTKDCREESAV